MTVGQFLADVARVGDALGVAQHVLNACSDRYHFAVGLAAAVTRGKVSLLPPTRTAEVTRQLRAFAPDVVCLTDTPARETQLPQVAYPSGAGTTRPTWPPAQIERGCLSAYVFTSGSTGTPVPYRKTWGPLVSSVQEANRRLGLSDGRQWSIVATVPPQHQYGLEASVLMPLVGGHTLCGERPFYPSDIAAALGAVPRPRALISTPVHLRALLGSEVALPATDVIVSATAPLAVQLAGEAERRYGTRVMEIYGSTETGHIAARRPTLGSEWRLWPGIRLSKRGEETWAEGGHVEQPTRLCDVLELTGAGRFLLHGRLSDLVNIAGKRSSLAYLNHQLNCVPGVLDGAFFHFDEARATHTHVSRVAACVVAPTLDPERLLRELRGRIDAAFLPRPLLFVQRLPRNATGKLTQQALHALAAAHLKNDVA
jgi:acyl-coenzyme A synthetase/AMP-(fatty) acid ligase